MPARRDRPKAASRRELLFAITGEDEMRTDCLKRLIRSLERPDIRAAVSLAIADSFRQDLNSEIIINQAVGDRVIDTVVKMAADCESAIEREQL